MGRSLTFLALVAGHEVALISLAAVFRLTASSDMYVRTLQQDANGHYHAVKVL